MNWATDIVEEKERVLDQSSFLNRNTVGHLSHPDSTAHYIHGPIWHPHKKNGLSSTLEADGMEQFWQSRATDTCSKRTSLSCWTTWKPKSDKASDQKKNKYISFKAPTLSSWQPSPFLRYWSLWSPASPSPFSASTRVQPHHLILHSSPAAIRHWDLLLPGPHCQVNENTTLVSARQPASAAAPPGHSTPPATLQCCGAPHQWDLALLSPLCLLTPLLLPSYALSVQTHFLTLLSRVF